jgi:hypothetical protein
VTRTRSLAATAKTAPVLREHEVSALRPDSQEADRLDDADADSV